MNYCTYNRAVSVPRTAINFLHVTADNNYFLGDNAASGFINTRRASGVSQARIYRCGKLCFVTNIWKIVTSVSRTECSAEIICRVVTDERLK